MFRPSGCAGSPRLVSAHAPHLSGRLRSGRAPQPQARSRDWRLHVLQGLLCALAVPALEVADSADLRRRAACRVGLARCGRHLVRLDRPLLGSLEVALNEGANRLEPQPRIGDRRLRQRRPASVRIVSIPDSTCIAPRPVRRRRCAWRPPKSSTAGRPDAGRARTSSRPAAVAAPAACRLPRPPYGVNQGVCQRHRIAGRPGDLDRLSRQPPASRRLTVVKLAGQQREHLCPSRIIIRKGCCRCVKRAHSFSIRGADLAGRQFVTVGEHRTAQLVCVAEVLGELGGVKERLTELRVSHLSLCLSQAAQQLTALGAVAGRLVVEIKRLSVPARRLVGGELRQRALPRPPGRNTGPSWCRR